VFFEEHQTGKDAAVSAAFEVCGEAATDLIHWMPLPAFSVANFKSNRASKAMPI